MKRIAVGLAILAFAIPAYAWNSTGHKAIALIAYNHLSAAARTRVDQLLSQPPDYSKWIEGVAVTGRGRTAFLEASTWPDTIRNDPRFHADANRATPNLPGLPPGSQARHAEWYYMNVWTARAITSAAPTTSSSDRGTNPITCR